MTVGHSSSLRRWYSPAAIEPIERPATITWERASASGFRRIGFMSMDGSRPAASAWSACARPISPPSAATNELSAMFWALNGATRKPSWRRIRQSAVTSVLLPACEAVPWTIRTGRELLAAHRIVAHG